MVSHQNDVVNQKLMTSLSATPTCNDGALNRDETDIDCGGTHCNACANGKKCAVNGDCVSSKCTNSVCGKSINQSLS